MSGGIMSRWTVLISLCLAPLLPPQRLAAQEDSVAAFDLPDEVAEAMVDFFNDPLRVRFHGPARVPADSTVRGDVAVLEGPFVVAGRIEGSIAMVNGDVELLPGALVTGGIIVVGGVVEGAGAASVRGEILAYPEPLRYRREGDRIIRIRPRRAGGAAIEVGDPRWGRSDFLVTTGRSYNRVEGLPITFGPRIETEGSNPLRVHALGIYRTESGFAPDTDDMGYYVRAEQFLGGHRRLRIGASAYSSVDPIEEWHVTDLENGLATFLFHQDYRDHFEREGVSLFSTWQPPYLPVTVTAELRRERHRSLAAGSPWTVLDNADPWRPQPLVAEGDLTALALQTVVDTRSDRSNPATGWYLRGRVQRAMRVDLTRPALYAPGDSALAAPALGYGAFTAGLLDVRRYNRVDPTSRLNFRLVLAGSLDGSPLPPQYQHAIGGQGSLPGYGLFSGDCGARAESFARTPESGDPPAFFGQYGCDAMALLQAEYRGKLSFRFNWGADPWSDEGGEGWGLRWWDFAPDWAVFVNAGRAWALDDRPDQELVVDVGAGFLVDRFGIYAALPVSGGGDGLNVFVRLGPRF